MFQTSTRSSEHINAKGVTRRYGDNDVCSEVRSSEEGQGVGAGGLECVRLMGGLRGEVGRERCLYGFIYSSHCFFKPF